MVSTLALKRTHLARVVSSGATRAPPPFAAATPFLASPLLAAARAGLQKLRRLLGWRRLAGLVRFHSDACHGAGGGPRCWACHGAGPRRAEVARKGLDPAVNMGFGSTDL